MLLLTDSLLQAALNTNSIGKLWLNGLQKLAFMTHLSAVNSGESLKSKLWFRSVDPYCRIAIVGIEATKLPWQI